MLPWIHPMKANERVHEIFPIKSTCICIKFCYVSSCFSNYSCIRIISKFETYEDAKLNSNFVTIQIRKGLRIPDIIYLS